MNRQRTLKLGEACEILNGYAFKSGLYVEEGIRIIRIANVQKGYIEDNSPCFYPYESKDDFSKFLLRKGDLLISLTGNVGRVGLLPAEMLPAALNQRVACVRMKDSVPFDKGYLFHLLNSDLFEQRAIDASNGVAQKNLSTRWLSSFELPLIPMEEQVHRRSVLDCLESCISRLKRATNEFDFLIKSRFVEIFGDLDSNEKDFSVSTLGSLLLIERGGSPRPISQFVTDDPDGVNWIKIGDAEEGSIYITHTVEKIKRSGIKKSRHVVPGDFLLSNSMSFGRPYILKIDGYIHDGWLVLRDSKGIFDKMFLHTLLSSDYAMREFSKKAAGTTVKNLNKDIVSSVRVPVPPIDIQHEFADFVAQVDKSKFAVQKSIEQLELLKAKLMQEYFG